MSRFSRLILAGLAAITLTAGHLRAAVITAGHHVLAANTPGQMVSISIQGDPMAFEVIAGLDFFVQVDDGLSGPVITNLDLVAPGSMFDGVTLSFGPNPTADDAPTNRKWEDSLVIDASFNGGVGLMAIADVIQTLAVLTLDTTGIAPGVYDLLLSVTISPNTFDTDFTDSQGLPLGAVLVNGTLTIPNNQPEIPAPLGSLTAACGMGLFALFGRRRQY